MTHNLEDWANYAYTLAEKAGEKIMHYYAKVQTLQPEYKEDNSPLTDADKAAHDIIYQGLVQYALDNEGPAPVLSEEGQQIPFSVRQTWHRYWCVDPLDGTREFLAQNDEFAVNIALISQHEPVLGIIYVPAQKLGYLAWRGGGAYRCDSKGDRQRILIQSPPHQPWRVLVSRHCSAMQLQPWLTALGETTLDNQGSSLKFGALASGEADIMLRLSPTSEWDNAAGHCILEEAGGAIFCLDGQPLSYNRSGTLTQGHFVAVGDKFVNWENIFKF